MRLFFVLLFLIPLPSLSQKDGDSLLETAKNFRRNTQYDSSIYYSEKAIKFYTSTKDSIQLASAYNNLGLSHLRLNNRKEALEYLYSALKINKNIKNDEGLVGNYNNLGNYYFSEDLKLTLKYYQKAVELLSNNKKGLKSAIINMNIGIIYATNDSEFFNYDSAVYHYLNSLEAFKEVKDTLNLSAIYHNLGALYENQENFKAAIKSYSNALELNEALGDKYGLTQTYMGIGNVYLKQDNYKKSIEYYEKGLVLAEELGDYLRKMNLYSNLVKAKMGVGEIDEASAIFQEYNHLRDSLFNSEKMQELKGLETKYETEQKEAEIREQQIAIAEKDFQKNVFLALSILLVFLIVSTIWFFLLKQNYLKKLKNEEIANLKTEQELKELNAMMHGQEEERNRIASDLHDRLGARLSSIKLLFQSNQNETPSRLTSKLLSNINEAIRETREISHNLSTDILTRYGLEVALKDMVRSINESEQIKAELATYGLRDRLLLEVERNIYHICLELINNTIKHAEAQNIMLQISQTNGEINVFYEDDGKGFDTQNIVKTGMGMRSIQSRVSTINGTASFNSKPGKGINAVITIPIVETTVKMNNDDNSIESGIKKLIED